MGEEGVGGDMLCHSPSQRPYVDTVRRRSVGAGRAVLRRGTYAIRGACSSFSRLGGS